MESDGVGWSWVGRDSSVQMHLQTYLMLRYIDVLICTCTPTGCYTTDKRNQYRIEEKTLFSQNTLELRRKSTQNIKKRLVCEFFHFTRTSWVFKMWWITRLKIGLCEVSVWDGGPIHPYPKVTFAPTPPDFGTLVRRRPGNHVRFELDRGHLGGTWWHWLGGDRGHLLFCWINHSTFEVWTGDRGHLWGTWGH